MCYSIKERARARIYSPCRLFVRLHFIDSNFAVFFSCSGARARLQLIKHVEIIYIEPIYMRVGVIKSSLTVCFVSPQFSLRIGDWLG